MKLLFEASNTTESRSGSVTETFDELAHNINHIDGITHAVEDTIEEQGLAVLTGESMSRSLEAAQTLLQDDNVSELTYEAATTIIGSAVSITGYPLDMEKFTVEAFQANKDLAVAELAETTENFITDAAASIARTTRKITRSTLAFTTVLFNRQKAISKAAEKLQSKMMDREAGKAVAGTTVKNAKSGAWFNSPEDMLKVLSTFVKLRAGVVKAQANLSDMVAVRSFDGSLDEYSNTLAKIIKPLANVDGALVSAKLDGITEIRVPHRNGKIKAFAIGALNVAVTSSLVGGAAMSSGLLAAAVLSGAMEASLAGSVVTGVAVAAAGAGAMLLAGAAVGTVVTYMAVRAVTGWVFARRLPTLEFPEIQKVLTELTNMSDVEMSLKGVAKASAILEKTARIKYKDLKKNELRFAKPLFKAVARTLGTLNSLGRDVYKGSIDVAKAALAYSVKSLKKHNERGAGQLTGESRTVIDEDWARDLDTLEAALVMDYDDDALVDSIMPEDQFDAMIKTA